MVAWFLGRALPLQGAGGVWANPPCSAKPNAPTGDRPLNELGEGVEGHAMAVRVEPNANAARQRVEPNGQLQRWFCHPNVGSVPKISTAWGPPRQNHRPTNFGRQQAQKHKEATPGKGGIQDLPPPIK